jgi:uncharacterized membrane-anchored protein
MTLPANHPQRFELNDEVHARPPETLVPPLRISFLALFSDWNLRDQQYEQVSDLARRFGVAPPAPGANHCSIDMGPFRLKWERHTEFSRYQFIVPGSDGDPFAEPAINAVPADWVSALKGQVLVATHLALIPASAQADHDLFSAKWFDGNPLVGAAIAGGAGAAFTDLRIHGDGFGRLLVQDLGMTAGQAGRMIQRLLEIDAYRMLALLALPIARSLAPVITQYERELAEITASLSGASEADEPLLLDRLTRLDAAIESRRSDTFYRFSAADAYYELVQRRIAELREERIQGLQTFQEFTERRLAPAMSTCRSTAGRHESLSQRVARTTQLLSTRVGVTREQQNKAVLESMNRRAKMQLRLQETVESLSIAAASYYIVGLVGYAAKGLEGAGVGVDPNIAMGISLPFVAVLVALVLRRIRKVTTRKES